MSQPALTEGAVWRRLLDLAIPFLAANFLHIVVLAVDRIWVGQIGTSALAGLGMAHAALMLGFAALLGPAIGTLGGVAQSVGAKDTDRSEQICAQGFLVSLGVGAVFAGSAFFAPELLVEFMDAGDTLSTGASDYLRISLFGLMLNAPLFVLTFAIQGAGDARSALKIQLLAPLINGLLDPIFIFGLDMGLAGAAWASLCGYAAALTLALVLIGRPGVGVRLKLSALIFRPHIAMDVIRVGLPGTLEQFVRTLGFFALFKIMAPFEAMVLSAFTASVVITMLLVSPGLAIGQATSALVGQNLGAGETERAWKTAWTGVALYSMFMCVSLGFFYHYAAPLIQIFDDNPEVVRIGAPLLKIMTYSFPLVAVALVLSKAFAGASKTRPPMLAAAFAHLIFQLPLAVYWAEIYGPAGVYWAMTAAFVVHATLNSFLFWYHYAPSRVARTQTELPVV